MKILKNLCIAFWLILSFVYLNSNLSIAEEAKLLAITENDERLIAETYPNWKSLIESSDFNNWKASQNENINSMYYSGNPFLVITVINKYLDDKNKITHKEPEPINQVLTDTPETNIKISKPIIQKKSNPVDVSKPYENEVRKENDSIENHLNYLVGTNKPESAANNSPERNENYLVEQPYEESYKNTTSDKDQNLIFGLAYQKLKSIIAIIIGFIVGLAFGSGFIGYFLSPLDHFTMSRFDHFKASIIGGLIIGFLTYALVYKFFEYMLIFLTLITFILLYIKYSDSDSIKNKDH